MVQNDWIHPVSLVFNAKDMVASDLWHEMETHRQGVCYTREEVSR